MSFRDSLKAWLPVVLWMGLIFFGSTDLLSAEHTSRERFSHAQLWCAAVLLFGAFLATRVKPAVATAAAENI